MINFPIFHRFLNRGQISRCAVGPGRRVGGPARRRLGAPQAASGPPSPMQARTPPGPAKPRGRAAARWQRSAGNPICGVGGKTQNENGKTQKVWQFSPQSALSRGAQPPRRRHTAPGHPAAAPLHAGSALVGLRARGRPAFAALAAAAVVAWRLHGCHRDVGPFKKTTWR